MVEENGTSSGKEPEPTSTRHEKPIIEGEIVSEAHASPESDDVKAEDATTAPHDEPASADAPAATADANAASPAHKPRASLWPIAAAIVIGAGLAVGGAYLLRGSDTNAEDFAALTKRQAELTARLAAFEAKSVETKSVEAKPDADKGLAETLAAQEKRLRLTEATAREAIDTAKSALAAANAAGKTDMGTATPEPAPAPAPSVDLTPLQTQIGDLERRLGGLDQKLAQLAASAEPKQDARVPEDKAVAPPHASSAEAVAIIANSLAGKVERGVAYEPELSALANLGVDKTKRAPLEPSAATGVATREGLAAQFAALSNDLLASEPEQKTDGSFVDKLMRNAGRLVRVRKVGDTSGDDLPAQIARVNAALRSGTLENALAAWNELPAPAKEKSQAFGTALKNRVAAAAAARAIEADAVAALGKPRS